MEVGFLRGAGREAWWWGGTRSQETNSDSWASRWLESGAGSLQASHFQSRSLKVAWGVGAETKGMVG